jgi:2-methylisocitrate lyase-like PEP mutase family enzyme
VTTAGSAPGARPDIAARAAAFRALHESGTFVMPNPWDAGSARLLETLGFPALATTSSGFAFTLGRRDGRVTLAEVVAHVRSVVAAVSVPLSVDLENGYGPSPEEAATAVTAVGEAGAVGGSIEDYGPGDGVYAFDDAVERVRAAADAAARLPFPFTLTARAENLIRGSTDLDDTIARLVAYAEAGADVLFAPGLREIGQIRAVCSAVPRPVNVLITPPLTVGEAAEAGARRISVGGGLTWVAGGALLEAATELRDQGTLGAFARSPGMRGIVSLLAD